MNTLHTTTFPRGALSELGVGAQGVEVIRGVFLASRRLAEAGRDLVERAALGLGHLEVGEGEEAEQQHSEDDEDVRPTQILRQHTEQGERCKK